MRLAFQVHDSPGFIAIAGRFIYVTPEIVARTLFVSAWKRFAEHREDEFIEGFPIQLWDEFQLRVAQSAPTEVRTAVGGSFRRWVGNLAASDFADLETIERLIPVIETTPQVYLPIVSGKVERASVEELLQITGEARNGKWGPRRQIVWLFERLSGFREFWHDAERALMRLALAESEPDIGNNATATWIQLFRIALSGTEVPFQVRLERLNHIVRSSSQAMMILGISALDGALEANPMKMGGPATVAGRVVPQEWRPASMLEYRDCYHAVIGRLVEYCNDSDPLLAIQSTDVVLKHFRRILAWGFLDELKVSLSGNRVDESRRFATISKIEEFLEFEGKNENHPIPPDYLDAIRAWSQELIPSDRHGRLRFLVSVSPWHYSGIRQGDEWAKLLAELASELIADGEWFSSEVAWLCSFEAQSSKVFGREVGRLDASGDYVELVCNAASLQRSAYFGAAYIAGLLGAYSLEDVVNSILDKIEETDPAMSLELALDAREKTNAVARAIRLIDSGAVSPTYLQNFVYSSRLTVDQLRLILERLLAEEDSKFAGNALDLLAANLLQGNDPTGERTRHLGDYVWKTLESIQGAAAPMQAHWWPRLLVAVASTRPTEAAALAVGAAISRRYSFGHDAMASIIQIARSYPAEFLDALGALLGDKQVRAYFYLENHKDLIGSIPSDALISWLPGVDREIVWAIARHLPDPYLGQNATPFVPEFTAFVLETFESDDRVFNEFCAGMHNMDMYEGDIAGRHDAEATLAQKFLNHPLRRIREWATIEESNSLQQAAAWRQMEEEDRFR